MKLTDSYVIILAMAIAYKYCLEYERRTKEESR